MGNRIQRKHKMGLKRMYDIAYVLKSTTKDGESQAKKAEVLTTDIGSQLHTLSTRGQTI